MENSTAPPTVNVKYGKETYRINIEQQEGKERTVLDMKTELSNLASANLDSIKFIAKGRVLRDEELLGSRKELSADATITMMASSVASSSCTIGGLGPHSKRVINDLSTDGVQLEVHPSQLTYNVHERARVRTAYEFEKIEVY